MSLQVWLPLDGDLRNLGCSEVTATASGATVNTSGKIGSCYSFDGSNDFISLFGNTLYNIFKGGSQQFSICFWVYHNDATRAIIFGDYGLSGAIGFNIELTTSHGIRFYWNGSPDKNFNSTSYVTAQGWTHIVITYSGSILNIYRNGILSTDSWSGTLATKNKTTGQFYLGRDSRTGTTVLNGRLNDFRIYDHCLSAAEVREISQGLVLHYKLDGLDVPNPNLGGTSADYNNKTDGSSVTANSWGGDAGTITFYHSGGYAGLPYKVYHKTATGSGGIYTKTANDINLEANTTYTMSCWIKGSRAFNASQHTFNINRGSDNLYITYGATIPITTDWQFFSKTFTTTDTQNGAYGEMSIVYDDGATDYYVYYSGFKIEKGSTATRWTPPGVQYTTIQDSSGYNHNGTINSEPMISSETARYNSSILFDGIDDCIIVPYNTVCPENIFTFNLWFKKDTLGSKNYETLFGGPSGFEMDTRAGSATTLSLYMASTRSIKRNLVTELTLGKWYMITMTRDGTKEKYYVNGIFQSEIDAKAMPTGTYRIGAWSSNTSQNYYGLISDFRIYCTALDTDSIRQLYEVGAKIDNKQNLHTFELNETNINLLSGIPWCASFSSHTPLTSPFTNYNSNGEPQFTSNSTSAGSDYIEISPTGHTYEYDYTISVNAGNQFYIGFERYDANKTARSNNACVYTFASKPSSDIVKQHYTGTINLATDGVNPCKYIALRILNGWSGTTSGITGTATIHSISLRQIGTKQQPKITKTGLCIGEELKEETNTKLHKNGIIEANEIIEL